MNHTVKEKKSRDLMVRLMRAVDYIEKHQDDKKINIPEPGIDPDSYFSDIPEGFYDKDLIDIQSMNLEDVQVELASAGYDKKSVANNLCAAKSNNVIKLPIARKSPKGIAAYRLSDNLVSYFFKEALGKSYMLSKTSEEQTKESENIDENNQHIHVKKHNEKSVIENSRYMQKAALMFAAFAFTSIAFATAKPVMEHIDYLLAEYNVWKTPELASQPNSQYPILTTRHHISNATTLNFDQLDLNYENAIHLLDKIKRGEVYLTVEEKRNLFEKMYSMAKADQRIIRSTDDSYDSRRACVESNLYRHVVRFQDTIIGIIKDCSYTIKHDLSGITEVLDIDDILLIKVNNKYEVIRIDIDKNKKSGIKNLFNSTNY